MRTSKHKDIILCIPSTKGCVASLDFCFHLMLHCWGVILEGPWGADRLGRQQVRALQGEQPGSAPDPAL